MINYEVEQLPILKHKNIIDLLGYSNDKNNACLLYPYLENGTLANKLKDQEEALTSNQRLVIITGKY